jgi:hypothetical protein
MKAWNAMEQTGSHVYIAALAPTDHRSSIESFQTNRLTITSSLRSLWLQPVTVAGLASASTIDGWKCWRELSKREALA